MSSDVQSKILMCVLAGGTGSDPSPRASSKLSPYTAVKIVEATAVKKHQIPKYKETAILTGVLFLRPRHDWHI